MKKLEELPELLWVIATILISVIGIYGFIYLAFVAGK